MLVSLFLLYLYLTPILAFFRLPSVPYRMRREKELFSIAISNRLGAGLAQAV
jgi:hypothetical protein